MDKYIFVVEDNLDIRELIEHLLITEDMKVRGFATVNEFQKNLESDLPDLILLDIMLPDGNGIDVCRTLASNNTTNKIPVILMSANISNQVLAKETTAKDFIPKPFDIDDFISRIKLQLQA
jgi:two-component system phosphate regulon response regulator PhoB